MAINQLEWSDVKGMMEQPSLCPSLDSARSISAGSMQSMNTNMFGKMDIPLQNLLITGAIEAAIPIITSQLSTVFSSFNGSSTIGSLPSGFNQTETLNTISNNITNSGKSNQIDLIQSQSKSIAGYEMQRVDIANKNINEGAMTAANDSPTLKSESSNDLNTELNTNNTSLFESAAWLVSNPIKNMNIESSLSTLKYSGFTGDQINIVGAFLQNNLTNDSLLSSPNITAATAGLNVASEISAAKTLTSNYYS